jgi:hypothetical protein
MRLCTVRAVSSTVAARLVAALVALALSSAVVQGASVVLDVPGMDAIFSQASFGSTSIDIRFDAPRALVAPSLLVIKSEAHLTALYKLAPDPRQLSTPFS